MKRKRPNSQRARRADAAVYVNARNMPPSRDERTIPGDPDAQDNVTDLLANLRHLCDARGWDFAALDKTAHTHYLAELVLPVGAL